MFSFAFAVGAYMVNNRTFLTITVTASRSGKMLSNGFGFFPT